MAVTFDLFGTLVAVGRPDDPAAAVADELRDRGVAVPADWPTRYAERHVDAPEGAEVPLPAHVAAALRACDIDAPAGVVRRAVVAAFDPAVTTRPGAVDAVRAADDRGPVGLLSNCSVPELVSRTLIRSALDRDAFDALVTSVGCGWRKPHAKAFEAAAEHLAVDAADVIHVGDTPATDGGIETLGGTFVDVRDTGLAAIAARLESGAAPESPASAETDGDGRRGRSCR